VAEEELCHPSGDLLGGVHGVMASPHMDVDVNAAYRNPELWVPQRKGEAPPETADSGFTPPGAERVPRAEVCTPIA